MVNSHHSYSLNAKNPKIFVHEKHKFDATRSRTQKNGNHEAKDDKTSLEFLHGKYLHSKKQQFRA